MARPARAASLAGKRRARCLTRATERPTPPENRIRVPCPWRSLRLWRRVAALPEHGSITRRRTASTCWSKNDNETTTPRRWALPAMTIRSDPMGGSSVCEIAAWPNRYDCERLRGSRGQRGGSFHAHLSAAIRLQDVQSRRRQELIPVVPYAAERRLAVGEAYRDQAALFEVTVLAKVDKAAREALRGDRAMAPEPWKPRSATILVRSQWVSATPRRASLMVTASRGSVEGGR
jgi:hypothetical protein